MRKTNLLVSILVILLLSSCNSNLDKPLQNQGEAQNTKTRSAQEIEKTLKQPSFTSIEPQELSSMLEGKDFILIDIHIPEQDHIEGTDLIIPYNEIENNLDKLPLDLDSKIVIYCRSGGMSQTVSSTLSEKGYTNIFNLNGGKRAYDEFLETQQESNDISASQKVDYIDIMATILTSSNYQKMNDEMNGKLSDISINPEKTLVLLMLDNHRKDLASLEYHKLATLDNQAADSWKLLSSQMGGHHTAGVLSFNKNENPEILVLSDLPVGDVYLTFNPF